METNLNHIVDYHEPRVFTALPVPGPINTNLGSLTSDILSLRNGRSSRHQLGVSWPYKMACNGTLLDIYPPPPTLSSQQFRTTMGPGKLVVHTLLTTSHSMFPPDLHLLLQVVPLSLLLGVSIDQEHSVHVSLIRMDVKQLLKV